MMDRCMQLVGVEQGDKSLPTLYTVSSDTVCNGIWCRLRGGVEGSGSRQRPGYHTEIVGVRYYLTRLEAGEALLAAWRQEQSDSRYGEVRL